MLTKLKHLYADFLLSWLTGPVAGERMRHDKICFHYEISTTWKLKTAFSFKCVFGILSFVDDIWLWNVLFIYDSSASFWISYFLFSIHLKFGISCGNDIAAVITTYLQASIDLFSLRFSFLTCTFATFLQGSVFSIVLFLLDFWSLCSVLLSLAGSCGYLMCSTC